MSDCFRDTSGIVYDSLPVFSIRYDVRKDYPLLPHFLSPRIPTIMDRRLKTSVTPSPAPIADFKGCLTSVMRAAIIRLANRIRTTLFKSFSIC